MKPIKFIYIILLGLLTFLGNLEFYKHSEFKNHDFPHDIFSTSDVAELDLSTVHMPNDLKVHFIVKKKAKPRVEETEHHFASNPYHTSLFSFQVLKEKIIYSFATLFVFQRNILFHLYHLF